MHYPRNEQADRYVIQQCTGLKDKNGALIYEGGIVKNRLYNESSGHLFLLSYEENGESYVNFTIYIPEVYQTGLSDDCEIVGNIFQNSELIKND